VLPLLLITGYFGEIPYIVIVFSNCKTGLLELSWVQITGIRVEKFLKQCFTTNITIYILSSALCDQ
jgi:hypothetical protein